MRRTVCTLAACAFAAGACTTTRNVPVAELSEHAGERVILGAESEAHTIDRIENGVLITADGRRIPLDTVSSAQVRVLDVARTGWMVIGGAAAIALVAVIASNENEDAVSDALSGR